LKCKAEMKREKGVCFSYFLSHENLTPGVGFGKAYRFARIRKATGYAGDW